MAGYLPDEFHANVIHRMHHVLRPDKIVSTGYSIRMEGPGTYQNFVDDVHTLFWDTFAASIDSQVSADGTDMYVGPSPSEVLVTAATPRSGTQAVSSTLANTALLAHKRTPFAGRRNRGRMYFPWYLNDNNVAETGSLTTESIPLIETQLNDWLADFDALDMSMVICHSAPGLGPVRDVSHFTVSPFIGTQRRRVR